MNPPSLPSSAVKSSTPKWIVVNRVIFALLTVVILAGVFRYQNGLLDESRKWVDHTHAVEEQIFSVFLKVKRMESAQRGYVLTGNTEYLKPYGQLLGVDASWGAGGRDIAPDTFVFHGIDSLRGLIADNPHQEENVDSLRHLIERRLMYSRFIINTRREKGLDEALSLSKSGLGARLTDSIETLVGRMVEKEQQLADIRALAEARESRTQKWVVYGGMALFFFRAAFDDFPGKNTEDNLDHPL